MHCILINKNNCVTSALLYSPIKISYSLIQLFNLKDTKENQIGCDSSIWNDEEAKFVAKLAQAVCNKLAAEKSNSEGNVDVQDNRPKTCGIITFYQKQRSTICLELQKMGITVKDDLSRCNKKSTFNKEKHVVSVKTVDGFQVRQFFVL